MSSKQRRAAMRHKYGVNCPACAVMRPHTNPSILLPQQQCKVDRYVDPRLKLTNEQWSGI